MHAPDCFRQQLLAAIPRLRRNARSLVFDTAGADDLVQTTLERGLSHWHQFDQRRDMLVWLLSIAHNAFLDQRRRDSRMSFVDPAQAALQQDLQRADPGVDIGLRIDLLAALGRLSVDQREPPAAGERAATELRRMRRGAGHSDRHRDVPGVARTQRPA